MGDLSGARRLALIPIYALGLASVISQKLLVNLSRRQPSCDLSQLSGAPRKAVEEKMLGLGPLPWGLSVSAAHESEIVLPGGGAAVNSRRDAAPAWWRA